MSEDFEAMLSGGHPNSLGRTLEVVDAVLNDQTTLDQLYRCYFSDDEIVRLRVSSAMKRITIEHPDWTMELMTGLQCEIAAINQPSIQWTLALLFDLTKELQTDAQLARSVDVRQRHGDEPLSSRPTPRALRAITTTRPKPQPKADG